MTMSSDIRHRIAVRGREGAALSNAEVAGLDDEIDDIVTDIRLAQDYGAAAPMLDRLGLFQELLSLLLFKYDASLSAKQKTVVRSFDRSDDSDLRLAIYRAVKEGRFP